MSNQQVADALAAIIECEEGGVRPHETVSEWRSRHYKLCRALVALVRERAPAWPGEGVSAGRRP